MNTQQPSKPRFTTEQVVALLLAAAGIGVTLIGVVLLLVMAAREGLLTPPIRVAGGAVLALGLAGVATWVRPQPGGRIGSVALLATGAAAAFFDVVAVTRIYAWVPLAVGLALALAIGGAAGAQAIRWNEKWLFQALVVSVAALAPFLTRGLTLTLVAFLVVLQVVGLAPELTKRWDETALVRTLPVVLVGSVWAVRTAEPVWQVVTAAVVIGVVGLAGAVSADRTRRNTIHSTAALVLSWIPLWMAAAECPRLVRVLVCAVMLAVALVVVVTARREATLLRLGAGTLAVTSALMLALASAAGQWRAMPMLALAVVLMLVHVRMPARWLSVAALASLGFGFILQATVASYLDLFDVSRTAHLPTSVPVAGILFIAFGITGALAVQGTGLDRNLVQTVLATCGAASVLGLAMVVITAFGGSADGFAQGHLVVTVLSVVLATVVLMAGLRVPRHLGASMGWGMALVFCALTKLFLFDLHSMGAMTKAVTFMGVGLVLLAAGTVYARTYAQVSARTKAQVMPSAG